MKKENVELIRGKILSLIETEYESDAAFERDMGLPDKTVNNWRRGRSSSFMRIIPSISESFDIGIGELLDMPVRADSADLSNDELSLLTLYRESSSLPPKMREALKETLENTIRLYIASSKELLPKQRTRKKTKST